MRPVAFTYSGTVAVPIADVFDLISDPTRLPEWLPGCHAVVPGSATRAKGERHRLTVEREGRQTDIVIEIIEYQPPTAYAWVEILHRRGAKTFFKLGFQGGSTRITMKQVWTPPGWRAWLLGQVFRRRNAHRTFERLLQNVRTLLTK
jgi:uncharacterized protein YndB with AHSA1/START domain